MLQMWIIPAFVHGLGIAIAAAACAYACVALLVTWKHSRRRAARSAAEPCPHPVSVLKPLRGADPYLHENLRSFCLQSHPDYQLVFGVRDLDDPAVATVQQLHAEFPRLDMALAVSPCSHGSNPKVSNLINMLPFARHDWLVLADSDIRVPTDYLSRVTAPLAEPDTGIVTCLYRGIAEHGFWSWLGRMFIDDWFVPSVRLAYAFSPARFTFGSTIALRRDVLDAMGGFEVLRNALADDFWLGELVRRRQLHIVTSNVMVGTQVSERRLSSLWTRELRWLRTVRAIAPWGFSMTWVCFTSPLVVVGFVLAPGLLTASLAALGLGARFLLHSIQSRAARAHLPWYEALLFPLRDGLLLLQWSIALTGWQVRWHGRLLDARGKRTSPGLIRNSTT
ncbi:MAG: glycosyltransferase [Rhodanobacteraceae bacterium]|nr:MAG: glycosyltransferase [Rhodanobacteraceae bacterium]